MLRMLSGFLRDKEADRTARPKQRVEAFAVFSSGCEAATDAELVSRIVDSYRKANIIDRGAGDSQWSLFLNNLNQKLHKQFLESTPEEIANYLRNPATNNLFYGFENIRIDYIRECRCDATSAAYYVQQIADALLRVCEATGAIPLDNPETYGSRQPTAYSVEELLCALDRLFGFEIEIPNPFPDEHGLHSARGVIGYRTVQAIYQAWRIKSCLSNLAESHVIEIGAGLGRTAFYVARLGIRRYTSFLRFRRRTFSGGRWVKRKSFSMANPITAKPYRSSLRTNS